MVKLKFFAVVFLTIFLLNINSQNTVIIPDDEINQNPFDHQQKLNIFHIIMEIKIGCAPDNLIVKKVIQLFKEMIIIMIDQIILIGGYL